MIPKVFLDFAGVAGRGWRVHFDVHRSRATQEAQHKEVSLVGRSNAFFDSFPSP